MSVIVVLLGLFATGCSPGYQPDRIAMAFQTQSQNKGRAVPAELQNPEKWVLVENKRVEGQFAGMVWQKIADKDHPEKWSDTEFTVETKPCGTAGEEDSIARTMFGKHDIFHVEYAVKVAEMTSVQHEQGLAALRAWTVQQGTF